MYFGQKSEEHVKDIKRRCLEVKTDDFREKCVTKKRCIVVILFPLFKGPGRAHVGPYGPIWALMDPYGPEKSPKIRKEIAFIGAFKVPCSLP